MKETGASGYHSPCIALDEGCLKVISVYSPSVVQREVGTGMKAKNLKIEISRAFQSLGFFGTDEVRSGYDKGQFASGDYGRYEDSGEWRPVEVIVGEMNPPAKTSRSVKEEPKKKVQCEGVDPADEDNSCFPETCCPARGCVRRFVSFIREVIARF